MAIPFSWSSFLGIALMLAGAGLYALRSFRPKLARDYDIFFAAVALLCGGILFFQGWRQDPILQFGQSLLTGTAIFFAYESIRLRGAATEQARRSTPIVDDDRPVSPSYRAYQEAEFEELNPYDERYSRPRIRPSRDVRSSRDEYDEEVRPRRSSSRTTDDQLGSGDRPRRRTRPRPTDDSTAADLRDGSSREDRSARSRTTAPRAGAQPSSSATRSRRPRPTDEPPATSRSRNADAGSPSSEYVDYRPIDTDEEDNWGDY